MNDDHPGTEELEQRLGAYASVRLAPRRIEVARIRASLVEEARMRSLDTRLGSRPRRRWSGRRRMATLLVAATLGLFAAAGVTAASSPGGPLYEARIWLETTTLPADPGTRALERIHQIDARVLDVERGAAAGDPKAVTAAIGAYGEAVQSALGDAGTDSDHLAHLQAALGLHVEVLQALVDEVPAPAVDAIDNAIDASQQVVAQIARANQGNGQGVPGAGVGNGTGAGNGAGAGLGSGEGQGSGQGGQSGQGQPSGPNAGVPTNPGTGTKQHPPDIAPKQ
ncbi:MAG: hypothetical protein HYX54_00455 [Chloroflexi bacterium]|nr:hypothetical protein [Chloroflexota bacterium]